MLDLVYLTPTYNRGKEINILFKSLMKQSNMNFTWLIIDDGSQDNTQDVVKSFIKEAPFEIKYYRKDNGGKSSSINYGINLLSNEKFVLIVDDDEELFSNATDIVYEYVQKYDNSDCVAIDFNRSDKNTKKYIANYEQKDDYFMSVQMRHRKGIDSDGYTGYFIKYIKMEEFPMFEGEKYIAPSVLLMRIANKHGRILWSKESIGETEYLEGGITNQGKRLRIKNPKGMVEYSYQFMFGDSSFIMRVKYSVYGYSWAYINNKTKDSKIDLSKYRKFYKLFKPFGYLYGRYILRKYKVK